MEGAASAEGKAGQQHSNLYFLGLLIYIHIKLQVIAVVCEIICPSVIKQ
jgi:hypothetical protein